MQAKAVCFFCLRKAWQIFAITLVTLAVLVSALKYALPYANDYKSNIETLIQKQLNVDISIGQISASWEGNGPALVLESLSFTDNQNSPISINIAKTSLQLNVFESVKQMQIASNYFVLEGFEADIDIRKLRANEEQGAFEQQSLIESLFLGDVGHFAVQNSRLNITFSSGKTHSLLLKDLVWQNSSSLHEGAGEIALPGFSQGQFNARLSLSGRRLRELAGNIYVSADKVNPIDWLEELITLEYPDLTADINAQLWLGFEQGTLQDITVDIKPSVLTWHEDDTLRTLALDDAQFLLTPDLHGFWIQSSGVQFSRNQVALPPILMEALWHKDNKTFWLENINASLLAELAQLAQFPGRDLLYGMNPNGQLTAAKFSIDSNSAFSAWGVIEDIAFEPYQGIPGIYGTRLELSAADGQFRLNLSAEQSELLSKETFKSNLEIEQLSGDIFIQEQPQHGWLVSSPNLWLSNQDVALATEFSLHLSDDPTLDLYAELSGGRGEIASRYFPVSIMRKSLVDYLEAGIQGGQHQQTQVLLNGPLSHFPFADKQGQFEVKSRLNDVTFGFAPNWPSVTSGDVTLHFENERMDIYAHHGKLVNQTIDEGVVVSIEDLNHADVLTVDILHETDASTLQPFFAKTPLVDPLANILDIVQASGTAKGDVHLAVDLHSGAVNAKGEVYLKDNPVFLAKPGMQLQKVTGVVKFDDDTIEVNNLAATWLDMPLSLDLSGHGDKQNYQVNTKIGLQAAIEQLQPHANGIIDGYFDGSSTLNTELVLNFAATGFNYKAKFDSDLRGIASYLPDQFAKPAKQARLLSGTVLGDDISNLITASVDNQLYFNGIIDNDSGAMRNAHLIIGSKDEGLNATGFDITIKQQEVELLPWLPLINRIVKAPRSESGVAFIPALNQVSGSFSKVTVADIPFHDVDIAMAPLNGAMQLKINSKEMRSQVAIPASNSSRPIHINSDYLRLNLPKSEQSPEPSPEKEEDPLDWLLSLPATEFVCADCKVDEYQLDKVNLSLFGDGNRLNISELVVDKKDHKLNASGRFEQGKTSLSGALVSDDFGELTDEFDITSTIKDSRANIEFDLAWQGAPYDMDLPSLGGTITWRLGEGHLAEISDNGARVFSLLSLDSLIRKLRLDFRDVFSKGFFYNSMSGSVQLSNGVAVTEDTKLDGVPADLSIRGYADLNTHEINYDLAVAPQVTSSLPVIMAWAVNPVTGLAALALDKVIHSARVISEINFKITGTMQEPVVTEVDRKSKEVELPKPIVPEEEPAPTSAPTTPKKNNQDELPLHSEPKHSATLNQSKQPSEPQSKEGNNG
ncbi:YhdP family protein [Pseudoalteromonas piscicida]|uniref:YhdP family protein n=1 Tax=Pseudoalteromonas piscicida TaxID=43662 RepID=UPI0030B4261B